MSESAGTSWLSGPTRTLGAVTSAARRVPGAGVVTGAVDGLLDTVGVVSPRTRRVAAYTGVGVLGAAGVVEWPLAAAGAALIWLTQARPVAKGAAPRGGSSGAPRKRKGAGRGGAG
ncbi:hypothetical protein ACFP1Z_10575 [Streptomyces gamaensis]|uniref:Uncharacterized protein n=1 Tax=Streptomyces gamaensis TaxID=1763542 RepID=A0ABW0YVI6_9ACTN